MQDYSYSIFTGIRIKPNAFVAIRITSPIGHKVKQVQDEMVRADRSLQSTMMPVEKLHVSLMVMKLATHEEEERSVVHSPHVSIIYSCFFQSQTNSQ